MSVNFLYRYTPPQDEAALLIYFPVRWLGQPVFITYHSGDSSEGLGGSRGEAVFIATEVTAVLRGNIFTSRPNPLSIPASIPPIPQLSTEKLVVAQFLHISLASKKGAAPSGQPVRCQVTTAESAERRSIDEDCFDYYTSTVLLQPGRWTELDWSADPAQQADETGRRPLRKRGCI